MSKKEGATIVPSPEDVRQARRSAARLRRLAKGRRKGAVRSITVEGEGQAIAIPASAFQALADAVDEMAKGHAIRITSHKEEVSTQKAADLLNVSRPYLIGLLEKGEMLSVACLGGPPALDRIPEWSPRSRSVPCAAPFV